MQYLIDQMLTCLLGAGLLGLAIGFIWWGMRLRQAREHAADLEQRVSKLSGYPARLMDSEATHAAFVASKNEQDAKRKARIAELELLAAKAPKLERSLAAKTAEWEDLRTQIAGKTAELATLQAKLSDLETQHRVAMSAVEPLPALTNQLQRSETRVGELERTVEGKDAEIAEHVQAHADKDVRLASLGSRVTELEPAAQRVPLLEAQIAQHVDAHREMVEHLEQLMGQLDEWKPLAVQVQELIAQVKQHEAVYAEKDARIAELAPLAASSTDLRSRLESAEYESNLKTRKLRMAEAGAAAHETEIAKLQDQILMHKTEIESTKQAQAKAVPLKAMAAAAGSSMGFYDVSEGGATDVATQVAPQDHVREFEKRIEELLNIESSKDAEIAKLRSKLADVEAAPDPDTRRQILLAAKNAELTHLRGVLNSLFQPVSQDEVARRAFSYAEDRGFGGGSATEDWLRAERDSHYSRLAYAWESTRSGTMF